MCRVSGVIGGCAGFADHVEHLSLRRSANKSKFAKFNLIGSIHELNVKNSKSYTPKGKTKYSQISV